MQGRMSYSRRHYWSHYIGEDSGMVLTCTDWNMDSIPYHGGFSDTQRHDRRLMITSKLYELLIPKIITEMIPSVNNLDCRLVSCLCLYDWS